MHALSRFIDWLWLRNTEPDVAIAQLRWTREHLPLLYILLVLNGGAVAYTHYNLAPASLTLGVFGTFFTVCVVRTIWWFSAQSAIVPSGADAVHRLRSTIALASVMALGFPFWAIALDTYGGALEHVHIAMFLGITMVGCIYCLMYLPQAAIVIGLLGTPITVIYYLLKQDTVYTAIAMNMGLVMITLLSIVRTGFQGFRDMVLSQLDIAAKQQETERLGAENARLAHTDSLTGLPNRRHFFAQLQRMIADRQTSLEPFAIGVLDLDNFKPVNDTFGHFVGDSLLAAIGERLSTAAKERGIIIVRLGGDEFGLIIPSDVEHATSIGDDLCHMLAQPYKFDGMQLVVGCSCGIALFPEAGTNASELFDRSDYALYHSKTEQRGNCTLFSVEHETSIRSSRAIEVALQNADMEQELEIHFQPIVDTFTLRTRGVEALARWTSPTLGRVPPDQFIPTAERIGVISTLTLTLLNKSLNQLARLSQPIGLSFNLSATDIASPETMRAVTSMIENGPIDPSRLTLEITETAVMRDIDQAIAVIQQLQSLGVRISLDDFGTGYSSLSYLRRLPLNTVKGDRSFASDLCNEHGRKIVTAISGLCHTLSLDCVIEGIEDMEQLLHARRLGYRMAQGYLFAKPMPIADLVEWLELEDERTSETDRPASSSLRGIIKVV